MAKKYLFRRHMPIGYYTAIGHAVVMWAALEIELDEFLVRMLFHKKADKFRSEKQILERKHIRRGFKQRMRLINELAPIFYTETQVKYVSDIIKRCRSLHKERNRIAHGEWVLHFLSKQPPKLMSRLRFHGKEHGERPVDAAWIRSITHSISEVAHELFVFVSRHAPEGPIGPRLREYIEALRRKNAPSGHSPKPAKHP